MFAAVMRKAGVPKQLECHGFVCDSPEEAILVAANLYQALLETMKRNKRPNSSSQVRTLVVSEKKRQVSELHLAVTAGNHSSSSSSSANPVPYLDCLVSGQSCLLVVGLPSARVVKGAACSSQWPGRENWMGV